jgi:hypothetical protein
LDADEIDKEAGGTSSGGLWVDHGSESRAIEDGAVVRGDGSAQRDRLVGEYRDQIDVLMAEAAVEREARLVAERRIVEGERDNALRELRRVERAFQALAAEVVGTEPR